MWLVIFVWEGCHTGTVSKKVSGDTGKATASQSSGTLTNIGAEPKPPPRYRVPKTKSNALAKTAVKLHGKEPVQKAPIVNDVKPLGRGKLSDWKMLKEAPPDDTDKLADSQTLKKAPPGNTDKLADLQTHKEPIPDNTGNAALPASSKLVDDENVEDAEIPKFPAPPHPWWYKKLDRTSPVSPPGGSVLGALVFSYYMSDLPVAEFKADFPDLYVWLRSKSPPPLSAPPNLAAVWEWLTRRKLTGHAKQGADAMYPPP